MHSAPVLGHTLSVGFEGEVYHRTVAEPGRIAFMIALEHQAHPAAIRILGFNGPSSAPTVNSEGHQLPGS
jgi:hypothetical protein